MDSLDYLWFEHFFPVKLGNSEMDDDFDDGSSNDSTHMDQRKASNKKHYYPKLKRRGRGKRKGRISFFSHSYSNKFTNNPALPHYYLSGILLSSDF